ncbi:MAG: tetratricopeptide repeat protein [Myxococcota bacterium]|nr:tetratricopeptide repeat protein [Myxococcota bacterium]
MEREEGVDPLVGSEIAGRYRVDRRVASGGMGDVYEGEHIELGRRVAIKVLSQSYSRNEEAVARFLREARSASRIDHPAIVDIIDLGRLDAGEPYLVMELLEGEDLADVIAREAPVPASRVVELLEPVASALDAVHQQGILHRDIKPANIFLSVRSDGSVRPKLLDFGLAALREAPDEEKLTRDGIVVGTPHYVSPEAAEGEHVDQRTDVYSLGLVAYELLAGGLPFDGEKPMSLLYAKVRRPAPTLSAKTGRTFDSDVERLIGRTLSRTPSKRPETCGELIGELKRIAESLPADSTQVDLPETAPAPVDDRPEHERPMMPSELEIPGHGMPWKKLGLALLLLLLLGGGLYALRAGDGEAEAPTDGPEVADGEETEATEETAPEGEAPEPAIPEAEGLAAPETPVEPAAEEPTPEAEIAAAPPPRRGRAPRRPAAEETPPPQAPAATPTPPVEAESDPERAASLAREGGTAILRGQFPRARQLYRQATYADPSHAGAWRGLGLASERMGLGPEAATAYERYLRLAPTASDAAQVRERLSRLR